MTKLPITGWVGQYLAYMEVRRDSSTTIRTRRYLYARIQRALPVPLEYATTTDLRTWLTGRVGRIADSSLRTELSGLRAFFRWLQDEELRSDDPTRRLPFPRAPRRRPRPMPEPDVELALTQADPRTKAIVALAAMAGLRACEIATLDWADIVEGPHPTIAVVGKGGHDGIVPVSPDLLAILHALPWRRGPVIRRVDGTPKPYLPHNISHRTNRYLHSIGISSTLHQLRHRAGTVGYRATRDPFAVKDFLRHASTQTTAGYAEPAGEAIEACATAVARIGSQAHAA